MIPRLIYLASSWRNKYQSVILEALRADGHMVYDFKNPAPGQHGFSWSEISDDWSNWSQDDYIKALDHGAALRGFAFDKDAMTYADTCVLLLPSGRSAHIEAGWIKGQGKDLFVLLDPSRNEVVPELMYKLADGIFTSPSDLRDRLKLPI